MKISEIVGLRGNDSKLVLAADVPFATIDVGIISSTSVSSPFWDFSYWRSTCRLNSLIPRLDTNSLLLRYVLISSRLAILTYIVPGSSTLCRCQFQQQRDGTIWKRKLMSQPRLFVGSSWSKYGKSMGNDSSSNQSNWAVGVAVQPAALN